MHTLYDFFQKTNKIVLIITQQPNIAQSPICIQNEGQDMIDMTSWHMTSLQKSKVISSQIKSDSKLQSANNS